MQKILMHLRFFQIIFQTLEKNKVEIEERREML